MPPSENSPPRPPARACSRCGQTTAHPFAGVGRVCLRCAGERAFATGSDAPFPSEPDLPAEAAAVGADAGPEGILPAHIGPYEIIEELGRGGMGRVYAARQRGLGRIVALKVLPVGPGAPVELEMRFLREAQTIARLRHPHIVAIHDSGRAGGHVYFSMDYLADGDLAHRTRARAEPFPPREVATLVAKVADALAHAHAEGVLHRDIKPSNILLDGDEPRLADFGLAAQLETSGDLTSPSGVFGTPHFLAPEALRGGGAALSTASDLYALGVVLYALLTGRTPFAGASPAELPALINDQDATAPRLLAPAVPRDLETICLKCLERDPARRYAGATALAADLRRFLAGEAIAARPPGRSERFLRFARRHRAAFVATAAVGATLIVTTIVSSWLAIRATQAEKHAATEAAASRAVSEFLQHDLLAEASPEQQPDRDLKLRTVLDRAAKKIDGRFPDQPLVEAALRETLANTYGPLGEPAAQQAQLERAIALLRPSLGAEDPRVLRLTADLAGALATQGRMKEADELGRRALAIAERTLGPSHPQTLHMMNGHVYIVRGLGQLPEAEALAARTLDLARRTHGPDHPETRDAMINLSSNLWAQRRLAEAEPINVEAVEVSRRTLGPEHPTTLIAMSNLASIYWSAGKLADSERMGREILTTRQRVLGPDHPETLRTMNNLATTLMDQGRFADAVALHEQILATRRRNLGAEHLDTLTSTMNLATTHLIMGQLETADGLLTPALAVAERTLAPNHQHTLTAIFNLADLRRQQGRLPEAEALAARVTAAREKLAGADSASTLLARELLGTIHLAQKKSPEAEAIFRRTLAVREKTTPDLWRTAAIRSQLGEALLQLGRLADAEPLLRAADEQLAKLADKIPPRNAQVGRDARARVERLEAARR